MHEKFTKRDLFLSGLYLVLWDDGSVEEVSYDQILYSPAQNSKDSFAIAFPNQAGISPDSVTYEEYWTILSSSPLPSSMKNSLVTEKEEKVTPDNGGPDSFISLSRLLAKSAVRESIWGAFNPTQEEFSLAQVQTGAAKLDLPLQLRPLSLAELQQLNAPAIFLNSDDKRIVTLSALDDKEAIIIDRGLTRIVSRDVLAKRYSGEALVPQAAAGVTSQIVAEDPIRVLTLQSKTEGIIRKVTLTNRGTQPLTLQIERPIPGVIKAELSADTLAPGQTATLSLQIKWRDVLKGNSQNVLVFVKTNDPLRPRLPLGFELRAPQTP